MGEVYDETLGAGEAYGPARWEMGAAEPVLEMEERCRCSDLLNSVGEGA